MNSRGERLNELQEIIRKTKKERGLALESLTQAGEEAAERRKELLQVEQEEELRRKVKIAKVCERKMRQMKHSLAHSAISRALNQWNARSSACILQIAALEKKRVARAREAELARLLEEEHRHAEDAELTCYLQATEARIAAQLGLATMQLATMQAAVMAAAAETDEDKASQYVSRARARAHSEKEGVRREVEAISNTKESFVNSISSFNDILLVVELLSKKHQEMKARAFLIMELPGSCLHEPGTKKSQRG